MEKLDKAWTEGKLLKYHDDGLVSANATTHKFSVYSKFNGSYLGYIKYFAQWRKFVFFPGSSSMFDCLCMREIAEFCETQTTVLKSKWKQ